MTSPSDLPSDPHDVDPAAARAAFADRHTQTYRVEPTRLPYAQRTADPDGGAARERLRELERQVRAAKRRGAPLAEVRAVQARIREHCARTGLHRQRYREQLHLGNQPPP